MNHSKASTRDPIQSLWIGVHLSDIERLCIQSYLDHGHSFHLYTYNDILNIPSGATVYDANEIVPYSEVSSNPFGGHVNLSNYFRFKLLFKKGGWWVDMDTVCLRPFAFPENYVFSSEDAEQFNRKQVNTTYIKSLPNAPFLSDCINFITERGSENLHWGECGVTLLSQMVFRNELDLYVKEPVTFCPLPGYLVNNLMNTNGFIIPKESYAIHLWNELWNRNNYDKCGKYDDNSLIEKLKKQHL